MDSSQTKLIWIVTDGSSKIGNMGNGIWVLCSVSFKMSLNGRLSICDRGCKENFSNGSAMLGAVDESIKSANKISSNSLWERMCNKSNKKNRYVCVLSGACVDIDLIKSRPILQIDLEEWSIKRIQL